MQHQGKKVEHETEAESLLRLAMAMSWNEGPLVAALKALDIAEAKVCACLMRNCVLAVLWVWVCVLFVSFS